MLRSKLEDRAGGPYVRSWLAPERWFDYDAAATIVAKSDLPYVRKFDFLHCGYEHRGHRFSCRQRWLCPRCSYLLARRLSSKFSNTFGQALQVHFLTIGLSADPNEANRLIFRGLDRGGAQGVRHSTPAASGGPSDYGIPVRDLAGARICRELLKLFQRAIGELTRSGAHRRITGAVAGREVGIRFTPDLRLHPHVHATLWSGDFTADDALALLRRVRELMRNNRALNYERLGVRVYPSIACYQLSTREDLEHVLRYSLKPVRFGTAYTNYAASVKYAPEQLHLLNRSVDLFLRLLPIAFHKLPRYVQSGACSGNSHHAFRKAQPMKKLCVGSNEVEEVNEVPPPTTEADEPVDLSEVQDGLSPLQREGGAKHDEVQMNGLINLAVVPASSQFYSWVIRRNAGHYAKPVTLNDQPKQTASSGTADTISPRAAATDQAPEPRLDEPSV